MRSGVVAKTKSKWYFTDPCIATATLHLKSENLLEDLNSFGFYFENLVIRDLRTYADIMGGKVFFYTDTNNLDIDAIVELPGGKWSIFEIKLGGFENIKKSLINIDRFLKKVNDFKKKQLISINVITAGSESFLMKTNNGLNVNVIPLDQLYIDS
ncbi:MAG: DUF4143 domain-containing protein [Mycoplasmataceae bacterium]|nr:DUF4143 domain-containing protein [Mycoplasmataceae bacterium]